MSERSIGRPWTTKEDELLAQAIAIHGEIDNWKAVAAYVPGRSNKACRKRWLHSLSPNVKKSAWTPEEDHALVELYRIHSTKWAIIARHIPGRTDDACSKRYREALDPTLKRDEWTVEEDSKLLEVYSRLGGKWGQVGHELQRSGLACRNRWRLLERKRSNATLHEQSFALRHPQADMGSENRLTTDYSQSYTWPTPSDDQSIYHNDHLSQYHAGYIANAPNEDTGYDAPRVRFNDYDQHMLTHVPPSLRYSSSSLSSALSAPWLDDTRRVQCTPGAIDSLSSVSRHQAHGNYQPQPSMTALSVTPHHNVIRDDDAYTQGHNLQYSYEQPDSRATGHSSSSATIGQAVTYIREDNQQHIFNYPDNFSNRYRESPNLCCGSSVMPQSHTTHMIFDHSRQLGIQEDVRYMHAVTGERIQDTHLYGERPDYHSITPSSNRIITTVSDQQALNNDYSHDAARHSNQVGFTAPSEFLVSSVNHASHCCNEADTSTYRHDGHHVQYEQYPQISSAGYQKDDDSSFDHDPTMARSIYSSEGDHLVYAKSEQHTAQQGLPFDRHCSSVSLPVDYDAHQSVTRDAAYADESQRGCHDPSGAYGQEDHVEYSNSYATSTDVYSTNNGYDVSYPLNQTTANYPAVYTPASSSAPAPAAALDSPPPTTECVKGSYYRSTSRARPRNACPRKRPDTQAPLRLSSDLPATSDPSIKPYACGHLKCWSVDSVASLACYRTSRDLSDHYKSIHMDEAGGDRPFRCGLEGCGKFWKSINGLQYHLQISKAHFQRAISSTFAQTSYSDEKEGIPPAVEASTSTESSEAQKKLYKCPHPTCHNRYKQLSGLRYHLAHGHPPDMPVQLDLVPPALARRISEKMRTQGSTSQSSGSQLNES
ncbi:hypothetical protein SERLA73DRAFT_161809 [Serpula lacrymans var. lacrymans S7.3]|uniref:Uncharacterized protein n=2 Tax=Serpula lacrymans var. lacrymans TaxID=341189 RepID=F8Q3X1_SERL3|nr:uncharacterized protein SERLADRAFT_416895 [Serpula lacrymans var. lacrymans S7.9]EGN96827.1 hypothetical protein SERLA73DRAFT_161809 [Serpula lacrymans var. lacrymans S7.3]EGO22430.1 hypothetical protein SERLADRAFT_416895 [Serpula lacrymans var. lacrymans S7.9]